MMQKLLQAIHSWRHSRLLGLTGLAVVWGVLLLGVAIPSWRDVRQRQVEIEWLETRLADLDRWTVAGLWLEPAVLARESGIAAQWDRVFPPRRAREELFLRLAEVADRCGVREFQLEEIDEMGSFDMGTWSTATDPDPASADPGAPPDDGSDLPANVHRPAITFSPYTVRASFTADYARTAAFLGGLERLERAVDVRRLAIRSARTGLTVELELEVQVSDPITS